MGSGLMKDPIFPIGKSLRLVWLDHYKGEVVSSMWWNTKTLKYVWISKKNLEEEKT
jgi:hypothetical protein